MKDSNIVFDLSEDGLLAIEAVYDELSGGKLAKQARSVSLGDHRQFNILPVVWSLQRIRECMKKGVVDRDIEWNDQALVTLYSFVAFYNQFRSQPNFYMDARALTVPTEYFHCMAIFVVKSYLNRHGTACDILTPDGTHGPSPDLGIPTSVVGKPIFIEVKAPELLRWNGSREVDEAPVRKGIIAALKKAKNKGQLTSSMDL